ncbi:MAG: site-2 protease family protein [Acidimicrobiales bacterium]
MKQSLRLGTISGIPVGLNWGLLIIAVLYLMSLATGFLPNAVPGATTTAYWLVATGGVAMFFASILAHELGHSLVAQREGIRVKAITLWLLGGVAEIEKEAGSPGAEFRIAAAGPAVSVVLAAAFAGAGFALGSVFGSGLVATMLVWLGLVNGILAVFNLVPAAPLDGGRILTAALWWRSGNPHRARATAATVGQWFGGLMLAVGVFTFFSGGTFWLLILGWFLMAGASAEKRRAQIFQVAAHASVGEVMAPLASPTDSAVTVSGLVAMAGPQGRVAFPIRGADGAVTGIVPAAKLRSVNPRRYDSTFAGDLVVGWSEFVSARSDEPLDTIVDRLRDAGSEHVLVYDAWGQQAGYIGLAELNRAPEMSGA